MTTEGAHRVPPQVAEAGTVELTSVIHPWMGEGRLDMWGIALKREAKRDPEGPTRNWPLETGGGSNIPPDPGHICSGSGRVSVSELCAQRRSGYSSDPRKAASSEEHDGGDQPRACAVVRLSWVNVLNPGCWVRYWIDVPDECRLANKRPHPRMGRGAASIKVSTLYD